MMLKAAMASVARHAKLVPVGQSPVMRFLPPAAQLGLDMRTNSPAQQGFVSARGVCGYSGFYPARVVSGGRIQGCYSGLRFGWFAETPSHLRGFASSAASAVPSGAGPGLPPPSGAEGGGSVDSARSAVNSLLESSKEAAAKMFPAVDNWMDPSGGGVAELVVPASSAIGVSLVAWLLLPRVLRKFHSYVESGPTARLLGRLPQEKLPYELSVFSALDLPARFLASAVTFSYLGYIVAPTSVGAQYLTQLWSGATVLSAIWFAYRWKSNAFTRMLTGKTMTNPERERYLTMDRLSSIGLFVLGGMAFAEACGVAVQSILTVGGIGGVATAFAARDILGNMLSGVSLQFSRPFTIGDTISAGSVIVNKSRARYRGYSFNLPVQVQDFEKIPGITSEIRQMLLSHPKVFLEKENPRCHVSQVGPSSANIAVSCNLKPMGTDDYLATGEELLIESARLVAKTGATLGTPA